MTTTETVAGYQLVTRHRGLDALRGLAILLMIADHLLVVTGHPGSLLRYTVTRAAVPLFMVIGGHLVRRLSRRLLWVFALGLVLPVLVPWLDSPNILCLYVVGALWISLARAEGRRWLLLAPLVLALTLYANGYGVTSGWYQPVAVVALMCLGALLPRSSFDWGARLRPWWLCLVGRWPLSVYVGHLLLLQAAVLLL